MPDGAGSKDHVVSSKNGAEEAPARPAAPKKPLSPEAQRALAEAEERRRLRDAEAKEQPVEKGGQAGPDPARYGDWEKGGIISDF